MSRRYCHCFETAHGVGSSQSALRLKGSTSERPLVEPLYDPSIYCGHLYLLTRRPHGSLATLGRLAFAASAFGAPIAGDHVGTVRSRLGIAGTVRVLVVPDGLVSRPAARDAGLDAFGLEGVPESIGVVAAVAEQPLRLWQVVQQRCRTSVIADLPGRHEEAQGAAVRVSGGMELGIKPPLMRPIRRPRPPF